jgi:hypothetical protein
MANIDMTAMTLSMMVALVLAVPIYMLIFAIVSRGFTSDRDARRGIQRTSEHDRAALVRAVLARQAVDTGEVGPRHMAGSR